MSTVGICSCAGNFNNLGTGSDCIPLLEAPQNLIFALLKKDDGSDNCIDVTGALNDAQMSLLFEAEIAHDRYYPLNGIKEYTLEAAEAVTVDSASGATRNVRKGRASVTYRFWSNNPSKLAEKLETYKCLGGLGVFITDTAGNILGKGNSDGNLCPRGIEDNSLIITPVAHSFEDGGYVDVKWTYTIDSGEETVEYILASDFASDFDALEVDALEDANLEIVSVGQTTMTYKVYKDFGSLVGRLPVKGLGGTSLTEGYNNTDTASVAWITNVESPNGTYTTTYASQDLSDVMTVRGASGVTIVNGFDTKRFSDVTGTVA